MRFLAFLLVMCGAAACGGSSSNPPSASAVSLRGMDGESTSIGDELDGRPILVSLWAVWCQPCKRELPELERIMASNSSIDVLAVNVGDDPQRIRAYLADMGIEVPVAIDPIGDLLTALDVSSVPATILFDEHGDVLWQHLGAVTTDQVESALTAYLVPS